jgi:hypothetical protein
VPRYAACVLSDCHDRKCAPHPLARGLFCQTSSLAGGRIHGKFHGRYQSRSQDWKALLRACGQRAGELVAHGPWYQRWTPFIVWVAMVAVVVGLMGLAAAPVQHRSAADCHDDGGRTRLRARLAPTPRLPAETRRCLPGRTTFQFTPDHFEVARTHSTARNGWALLRDVTRTASHVFLWIDSASAYCFRVADLPPSLSADEAVARIEAFRTAASSPAAASSEVSDVPGSSEPESSAAPGFIARGGAGDETTLGAHGAARPAAARSVSCRGSRAPLGPRRHAAAVVGARSRRVDRPPAALQYSSDAQFFWFGVGSLAVLAVGTLALAWLLSRASSPRVPLRRALLLVLACAPIVALATRLIPDRSPVVLWLLLAMFLALVTRLLQNGMRTITGRWQARAVSATVITCLVMILVGRNYYLAPDIWYEPDTDEESSAEDDAALEQLLFEQGSRIDAEVARMHGGEPGRASNYFVGFAGYGSQRVFAEEIGTAARAVGTKFSTTKRSLLLVNDRRDDEKYPLATVSALRHALLALGARMNKDEDVLFLGLSSHGSEDATVSVSNESTMYWRDLGAGELRAMLDESGIRWRVIVISACYRAVSSRRCATTAPSSSRRPRPTAPRSGARTIAISRSSARPSTATHCLARPTCARPSRPRASWSRSASRRNSAKRRIRRPGSARSSRRSWLRQFRSAHQPAVALARGAAAFVDGPHDQRLSAPRIARGEYPGTLVAYLPYSAFTLERGSTSTLRSLSSACSGPRKPIASNTSCAGCSFSLPGFSTGMNWPLSFFSQLICTVTTPARLPAPSPTNFFTVVRYTRGSAPNFAAASSCP